MLTTVQTSVEWRKGWQIRTGKNLSFFFFYLFLRLEINHLDMLENESYSSPRRFLSQYLFHQQSLNFFLVSCLLPSSLTLWWWALSECSTIAFSHSEFDKATVFPLPWNYTAKGKGHLFVTKCLSHSFTWQQSSMSFPTVKCQIWKPSIRLMFRVRLCAICNPGSILQSNKSLSNLLDGKAFWQWVGLF